MIWFVGGKIKSVTAWILFIVLYLQKYELCGKYFGAENVCMLHMYASL